MKGGVMEGEGVEWWSGGRGSERGRERCGVM